MAYRWSNEDVIGIGDEQVVERGVGGMRAPDQLKAVIYRSKLRSNSKKAPVLIV